MAEDIYIIDPDEGVSHDYHSFADCEALNRNLVSDTDTAVMKLRPTSGGKDTADLWLGGWTTNSSYFITFTAYSGYEATTPWGTTKATVQRTGVVAGNWGKFVLDTANYCIVEKLQFEFIVSVDTYGCFGVCSFINNLTVRNCVFRISNTDPNNSFYFINLYGGSGDATGTKIYRNIIIGDNYNRAIAIYAGMYFGDNIFIYQNTIYNGNYGIVVDSTNIEGTVYLKQNYCGDNGTNDFLIVGTKYSSAKNISSDSSSPDGTNYQGKNSYSNYFVDYSGGNFHLKSTDTTLKDAGDNLGSPYDIDFDGDYCGGGGASWDIGADQFVIDGSTAWGHDTGVTQDNIRNFDGKWYGTGEVISTGDGERIELASGEYLISEIIIVPADSTVTLRKNSYFARS